MKIVIFFVALLGTITFINAQTNFSGNWSSPELEMIEGIQYANAVPKSIRVTQTKDSIRLERTSVGSEGDLTIIETLPLDSKEITRTDPATTRTTSWTATWSNGARTLTLVRKRSYEGKPAEIEYTTIEVWTLSEEGKLVITKTSDAAVTDDWAIKATYSKV